MQKNKSLPLKKFKLRLWIQGGVLGVFLKKFLGTPPYADISPKHHKSLNYKIILPKTFFIQHHQTISKNNSQALDITKSFNAQNKQSFSSFNKRKKNFFHSQKSHPKLILEETYQNPSI